MVSQHVSRIKRARFGSRCSRRSIYSCSFVRSIDRSAVRSFRRSVVQSIVSLVVVSVGRSFHRSFVPNFPCFVSSVIRSIDRSVGGSVGRSVVSLLRRSVVSCFVPSAIRSIAPSFVRTVGLRPGQAGRSFGCSVGRSVGRPFDRATSFVRSIGRYVPCVVQVRALSACLPLSQVRLVTIYTVNTMSDRIAHPIKLARALLSPPAGLSTVPSIRPVIPSMVPFHRSAKRGGWDPL